MYFSVTFAFVGACEPSVANVARERLLTGVCANVRGQVIGAREGTSALATLERLVARVYAQVTRELVGAREAARTPGHGARVRSLVYRCLAGPIRIFARLEWKKLLLLLLL